jgi:hypothetical protein
LVACGTDTFGGGDSSPDGAMDDGASDGGMDVRAMSDGDGVDSGCVPGSCPVETIKKMDLPTCVRTNLLNVFWTSETATDNVGRFDKMQGMTMTASIPMEAIGSCALGNISTSFYAAGASTIMKYDNQLNPTLVTSQQQMVQRIAADEASTYVVWSHFDTIHGCYGGLGSCPGIVANPPQVVGLDMDLNNVYATGGQNPPYGIYRCARPGGNNCTTLSMQVTQPTAILLDGGTLYVSSFSDGTIYTIPKNGGALSPFATNQQKVRAMASDANNIYWITGDGNLVRSPKNSTASPIVLAKGQTNIWELTVETKFVYFVRHDAATSGGGLYRILK